MKVRLARHAGEGRYPFSTPAAVRDAAWTPAFAGVTVKDWATVN